MEDGPHRRPAATVIERNGKSCNHHVAWPPGEVGSLAPPPQVSVPARGFPFELDPFQQTAIHALEAGDSVLVAAHTSAGKTVVAEYAIAMALRDKTRVIYTSPLKALSNQKYKDFAEEYGAHEVGLMTGDVTLNAGASCLVMTTEILRSMLFLGSEIVREVQLLVFDEIHYIKDKERGVVWEEAIALLPRKTRAAFLSATIPNALEFAEWIAATHRTRCHVVYTDFRPVPLQHYVMPCGGTSASLYLVVDKQGRFKEGNFQKAMGKVGEADESSAQKRKMDKKKRGEPAEMFHLTRLLIEQGLDPVIVFALSKRQCEELALQLVSMTLTGRSEQLLIRKVFHAAMAGLSEEDQKLPQVTHALPMLERGVGVHHSGLLPIVKEVIEVLFGEGLVKVLFATETFSTGLNMPARTVVFAGVRKYDGASFRNLSGGEYIQMSGRAGRRGLDESGSVILMCDSRMEAAVAKGVLRGSPDSLRSAFRLTYPSLLSVLRLDVAEVTMQALITRSFRQFQLQRELPTLRGVAEAAAAAADAALPPDAEVAEGLYLLLTERDAQLRELQLVEMQPQFSVPFLQPGRLVLVNPPKPLRQLQSGENRGAAGADGAGDCSALHLPPPPSDDEVPSAAPHHGAVWAAVVNFERVRGSGAAEAPGPGDDATGGKVAASAEEALASTYVVDILAACPASAGTAAASSRASLARDIVEHDADGASPLVVSIPLAQIAAFGLARVHLPANLLTTESRTEALETMREAIRRLAKKYDGQVPLLDALRDMRVRLSGYTKKRMELDRTLSRLEKNALYKRPEMHEHLRAYMHSARLTDAAVMARREVRAAETMLFEDELKQRLRVLRRLGCVDATGAVTRKGQVAAGLRSGDCLVLAELLFAGALTPLSPAALAALLSCCVWSEPSSRGTPRPRAELEAPYAALREAARRVATVAREAGLPTDVEGYVDRFRPDLMDVVANWALGQPFRAVKALAESIFEGSLVRALRRLHELLLQLRGACEVIGDLDIATRFEGAAAKIHRDVVFAASLYL